MTPTGTLMLIIFGGIPGTIGQAPRVTVGSKVIYDEAVASG